MLQEHVNGDSLNLQKKFLPDGLKGQHDLKLIPAGDGDSEEMLFHLAKIMASDFVRSKIKIMLNDQRDF